MYETLTTYSRCDSDSRMDWNICSVIRGIRPLSSGESMSAPYQIHELLGTNAHIPMTYHHRERFTTTSLTVRKDSAVVSTDDIWATSRLMKIHSSW
jgi:hypothetical protein